MRVISLEDLMVDRLGAWQYWRSAVDGANAFLLWRANRNSIDERRLGEQVTNAGWNEAYEALLRFDARWRDTGPPEKELEQWANDGP